MMKSIVLDSSVYISRLKPQDIFNSKTKDFLLRLEEKKPDIEIIVPILIVLEVANVLRKPITEVILVFTGGQIVELTLDFAEKITPVFESFRLKTSDAVILASAKIHDADLISWDKKLVNEAKKLVRATTPEDFFD